jgi:outer membrane biosynthesis protein TonB
MEAPVREPQKSAATAEELHLLISELDDELSRYRWREAVWVSLVLHAVIFTVVLLSPKWLPGKIVILPANPAHKQTTFLTLPSDLQHVKPPKTDVISDKNRIAQTPVPVPNRETLRRLLESQRPGPPARPVPQPTQQAMQPQTPPAEQQPNPANPGQQQPQPPAQTARVQTPAPASNPNPFRTGAPGSVVQQAIQSAAGSHGTNHVSFGGDYGVRHERTSDPRGDLEILSDTMGVDFGPYLQRVVYQVREHWYNLIPESAKAPLMKKGKLSIEFAILKDGRVAGLRLAATSGDDALDRPAWGSITGSNPFPPLPSEFKGQFLQLRFKFYYNPDKNELD